MSLNEDKVKWGVLRIAAIGNKNPDPTMVNKFVDGYKFSGSRAKDNAQEVANTCNSYYGHLWSYHPKKFTKRDKFE